MGISNFFTNTLETREMHRDGDLRTRYYRNNFDQCLDVIRALAKKSDLDIRDVNKAHGEIYLLGNGFDVIVTISQINPIESGVDFKINYFSTFGWGKPRKRIVEFYKYLDANLKFKGVSLHQ